MPHLVSSDLSLPARSLVLLSLFASATTMVNAVPFEGESRPHSVLRRGLTYSGCYSSSSSLVNQGSYKYQTDSWCSGVCGKISPAQSVMALSDSQYCWCGNEIPSSSSKVDDSKCDAPCDGYGQDMCGGTGYWSVYLTGVGSVTTNSNGGGDSSSSSSSTSSSSSSSSSSSTSSSTSGTSSSSGSSTGDSTSTAPPTVITSITPGHTVVVTESATPPSSSSTSGSSGGGSSTAGIAAGVVVGVVALGGLFGAGAYFFVRQKKRRQAEELYQQRSQADFMRGVERKSSGTYSATNDSRMDPEAGRRNSVGSLADNQDYSRRILRVANPDA